MLLNQRTILWGSSDIMRMTANHWRKISGARAEAAAGARLASGPRVGPAEPDAVPGAAEKMVPSGPGPATRHHE